MNSKNTLVILAGFYPASGQEIPEGYEECEINSSVVYGRVVLEIPAEQILGNLVADISPHNKTILTLQANYQLPVINPQEVFFIQTH